MIKKIIYVILLVLSMFLFGYCCKELYVYATSSNSVNGQINTSVPSNNTDNTLKTLLKINLDIVNKEDINNIDKATLTVIFINIDDVEYVAVWKNLYIDFDSREYELPQGKYAYYVSSNNDMISIKNSKGRIDLNDTNLSLDLSLTIGDLKIQVVDEVSSVTTDYSLKANESISLKAVRYGNYKFLGWYIDNNCITEDYDFLYTFQYKNVTIVAKYEKLFDYSSLKLNTQVKDSKLYYSINGGDEKEYKQSYNNGFVVVEQETISKIEPNDIITIRVDNYPDTYVFDGWKNNNNEIVSTDLKYSFKINQKDEILTAMFSENSQKVSVDISCYDGFGYYLINEDQTQFKDIQSLILNKLDTIKVKYVYSIDETKFTFNGWYLLDEFGSEIKQITSSNECEITVSENCKLEARVLPIDEYVGVFVTGESLGNGSFKGGTVTVDIYGKDVTYMTTLSNGTKVYSAKKNSVVNITANIDTSKVSFNKWTVSGGFISDTSQSSTSLTIINSNVQIKATFGSGSGLIIS